MTERAAKYFLFALAVALVAEVAFFAFQVISKKTSLDGTPSSYSGGELNGSRGAADSSQNGEIRSLVVLKSSIRLDTAVGVVALVGGKVIYTLPYSHIVVATLTKEQQATLLQRPDIAWIEEDRVAIYQGVFGTADLRSFFVTYAYAQSSKPPVKVFIIDSGASPNIAYDSKTSVFPNVDPNYTTSDHGGLVASSFLKESKKYDTSISLNSIRNTDESGVGTLGTIVEGVSQAIDRGAKVINLSLSVPGSEQPQVWVEVANKAQAAGAVLIVSAGNQSDNKANPLAQHPAVISVGALDDKGGVADYSNGIREKTRVDVFTDGSAPDGAEGTSFAAPKVAAMVADIMARDGQWDAAKVKAQLQQDIADGKYDATFGERGGQAPAPTIQQNIQAANTQQPPAQPEPVALASAEPAPQTPSGVPPSGAGPPPYIPPPPNNGPGPLVPPPSQSQPPASPVTTQPTQTPPTNEQPAQTTPTTQTTPPSTQSSPIAQTPTAQIPSLPINTSQSSSGLVPCGITQGGNYTDPNFYKQATSCNFCYLASLIQRIVNFLIMVSIPISVALFAWAGVMFFTSAGNPKNIGRAKKIFTSVFWGFLLTLSGWLIVQLALQTITNSKVYNPDSFFNLNGCEQYNGDRIRDVKINQILSGISVAPGTFETQTPSTGGTTGGGAQITPIQVSANSPDGQTSVSLTTSRTNEDLQNSYDNVQSKYGEQIQRACEGSSLSNCREVVTATIVVESNGNPNAVSPAGAQGLMQVVGTRCSSSNTQCQINEGTAYITQIATQYRDLPNIMAGYNSGPSNGVNSNGTKPGLAPSSDCRGLYAWQCGTNPGGLGETRTYVANFCQTLKLKGQSGC